MSMALDKQAVSLFNFCGEDVRVIDRDGEPWFVLSEVCKSIGIENTRNVKARLSSRDVNTVHIADGIPGNPNRTIVNESGLYNVVFMSRKPEAEDFKRWVTNEVLPSIRKHGAYLTPERIEDVLLNPDTIIQIAQNLKAEQEARLIAEAEAAASKALADEMQPKATAFDKWMDADGTADYNTVAKVLGVGRNRMLASLRDRGVLMEKYPAKNVPYQQFARHFKVTPYLYVNRHGDEIQSFKVRVLPSGIPMIAKKLGLS